MDAERLVHYIKNPAHLYQISYTELKSLVLQYPYCQNLRYLLLKKSILENHKESAQNLQLAATYSNDRQYLYQQIKDKDSFNSEVDSFVLKEDYLELKSILPTQEEEDKSPVLPVSNAEPVMIEPEQVNQIEGAEAFPAETKDVLEENDTFMEEPLLKDLSTVVESELVTPANELNTLEEDDFEDITNEFDDIFIEDLLGIEPSNAVSDSEIPNPPIPEPKTEDDAISIDELIQLDSLTPLERLEKKQKKSKSKTKEEEQNFDIANINALIEETKKEVKISKGGTQEKNSKAKKKEEAKPKKANFKKVFENLPPTEFDTVKETFILPEPKVPKKLKKSKKQKKKLKTSELNLPKIKSKKELELKNLEKPKKIADKSLRDSDEIASETLAKLLIDQGSYDKAIMMYERLSLKFPEKSGFFAEQIENLKKL